MKNRHVEMQTHCTIASLFLVKLPVGHQVQVSPSGIFTAGLGGSKANTKKAL